MPRVVHFELPMDDPKRATKFYSDVFGWKINQWDGPMPYWLVNTGEGIGINGGMMMRAEPSSGTVNTIDVEDIDQAINKVVASGGSITMPKYEIPNVGYHAYCLDTEGNAFGIMQSTQPQPGM